MAHQFNCFSFLNGYRGIAQLVEQRSPKPRAEGSSPSAPAKQKQAPCGVCFCFTRAGASPRGTRSVPGIAAERRRWREEQRQQWRSGRNPPPLQGESGFRAPQEGNFKSFCPCQTKAGTLRFLQRQHPISSYLYNLLKNKGIYN